MSTALNLIDYITVGTDPRITVSVRLWITNGHSQPVSGIKLTTDIIEGPGRSQATLDLIQEYVDNSGDKAPYEVIVVTLDEYSVGVDSDDVNVMMENAERLRALLPQLYKAVRDKLAAKHGIDVLLTGKAEMAFGEELRQEITKYRANRRHDKLTAVSNMVMESVDTAAANHAQRKVDDEWKNVYRVLTAERVDALVADVNSLLPNGWKPMGGMSTSTSFDPSNGSTNTVFHQTMVRWPKPEELFPEAPPSMEPFLLIEDDDERQAAARIIDTACRNAGIDIADLTHKLVKARRRY